MNILLTGYSSKIGEELYKSLHELKHEIFLLGRKPIANYPESNWTSWALGTKPDLSNLPSIDVLIHIAWITKSRRSNFHLNVGGTIQLFEEIKMRNSKIIFGIAGMPVMQSMRQQQFRPISQCWQLMTVAMHQQLFELHRS